LLIIMLFVLPRFETWQSIEARCCHFRPQDQDPELKTHSRSECFNTQETNQSLKIDLTPFMLSLCGLLGVDRVISIWIIKDDLANWLRTG
jgi:hypothetical protein